MAVNYAGEYGPEGIEYPDGRHASNITVEVVKGDGSLATLYVDKDRSATRPNPITTDSLGNLWFFADPGEYVLIFPTFELPVVVAAHPLSDVISVGGQGWPELVNSPVSLVQIHHGFSYKPAGITCLDSIGRTVEYQTISHPAPGITEVTFGNSFGPGLILLS